MAIDGMHQIGEVAEEIGLSLRTIRHYEEVGLAPPSGRSAGGFRLYTDADVERLRVIKVLKPSGFSLEEMRAMLTAVDGLRRGASPEPDQQVLAALVERAEDGCRQLRDQVQAAERLLSTLRAELL